MPNAGPRWTAVWGERSSVPLVVLALTFAGLAVAMEVALRSPLKLPGHRALPGALALLLFAEAFAPLVLLALSAAVPAALSLLGFATPWAIAGWLVPAVLLVALGGWRSERRVRALVVFIAAGLLFGLLRYLTLKTGLHHTPGAIRLAGHLGFGGGGGLLALVIARRTKP